MAILACCRGEKSCQIGTIPRFTLKPLNHQAAIQIVIRGSRSFTSFTPTTDKLPICQGDGLGDGAPFDSPNSAEYCRVKLPFTNEKKPENEFVLLPAIQSFNFTSAATVTVGLKSITSLLYLPTFVKPGDSFTVTRLGCLQHGFLLLLVFWNV